MIFVPHTKKDNTETTVFQHCQGAHSRLPLGGFIFCSSILKALDRELHIPSKPGRWWETVSWQRPREDWEVWVVNDPLTDLLCSCVSEAHKAFHHNSDSSRLCLCGYVQCHYGRAISIIRLFLFWHWLETVAVVALDECKDSGLSCVIWCWPGSIMIWRKSKFRFFR